MIEYPLSYGQRALWFLQQMSPKSGTYNLVHTVRIRNEFDAPALHRAFQKLVERHPTLRTTFSSRNGEPIQRVHDHVEVGFKVEEASTWSRAYLDNRLAEEVYRPFDLEQGPLIRVTIFRQSPRGHILVLAMHHIITDLWSLAVLMYELGILYDAEKAGEPAQLREPRTQYGDYIRQQREMLDGPEGERLWSYWREQISGDMSTLNLPTDRPRPPMQTYRGSSQSLRINPELTQQLEALSAESDVPLHTTLLAAFQTLLHRYTEQESILVGYPKAGRTARVARLIGYFVNPVILQADFSGDPSFSSLLTQVHQTTLGAFEHDDYPFPLLVERLQPTRELSRSPLFQVMFAWQKTTRLVNNQDLTPFALNEDGGRMDVGSLKIESVALEPRIVPFDLSLLMAEADQGLAALLEYNTDLFDAATITRMLGHFHTLLEDIAAHPDRPISTLSLLTEAERHQLLVDWNDTDTAPRAYRSVPELFEAQVERNPQAIAVMDAKEQLTYDELNRRANQLAHRLQDLGIGPESVAGLLLERSVEAIIAMLGVLKAGAAYLPLDPTYPQERLAFMIEDTQTSVLVTQKHLSETLSRLPTSYSLLSLDADWNASAIAQEPTGNPEGAFDPQNAAYVIYTSGSTGQPKGVIVSHEAIANHCRDIQRRFGLSSSDRVLQFAAYSFDQSVEQILATLITGATLVLRGPTVWMPVDFPRVVSDFELSVVNLPPAYWHQWVQDWDDANAPSPNDQLRLVISGGDVMQADTLRAWRKSPMKDATLLNAYGPTETTITAMTFAIPKASDIESIPIGRPGPNRQAYILDSHGHPVPPGVPGELYLGGAGLARGYLNQPRLTAKRFIPDPFSDKPGARLYRTGDLARYRPDGNVEFLGRIDQQVKIRGFRVELGGVETILSQHPSVRQTVVLAREDTPGDKHLAAYIVPEDGSPSALTGNLRSFVKKKLPDYMVPATFVTLDAMPVTSSGKIDRQALPAPEGERPAMQEAYVAPRTPIEEELSRMWAEVLDVERVGIHDNFFELGGHSLIATQIVSRLRDTFQVDLPLRDIFDTPTVAGLATTIAQNLARQEEDETLDQLLEQLDQLSEEEVQAMLANEMGG